RLGFYAERLRNTREQHVPDDFGAGRAARLAREHPADAHRLKAIRQQRRMGRLAGAFAAFEGDESSTHRVLTDDRGRTERSGCGGPSSVLCLLSLSFRLPL